jgi:hypothetical protein
MGVWSTRGVKRSCNFGLKVSFSIVTFCERTLPSEDKEVSDSDEVREPLELDGVIRKPSPASERASEHIVEIDIVEVEKYE